MAEDKTPTNVVDVGNVHDNPNYKVSLNVDNNGNVIIYRSTNTPDRFSNTDFSKFEVNKTIGEQTYFASNAEFAESFSQSGKRNIYSFSTNIKPEEILHLQSNIYQNKELLSKLGGQEYINNIVNERGINNYRFDSLDNIPKNLRWSELYYSTNKGRTDGSKDILQREIVQLQNNGVKAIGVSPVNGAKNEYNILPIINEQSQLDIVAKGLMDKNLIETSLDTPTNVVDDVVVTRGLSNAEMAIPTNADGNIILYRATTDPNISIVSDFTDIGKAGQAGLGKQNYFAIDEMYAYLYSRPSINKNVYKFETNIKANQVLNLQSPTVKQLEVLSKISINEKDLKNWYMQITGESKVNTAIQNNLDYLLDNDIKAIGNNLTGPTANVFEYEIVPIITEKTRTEIKPVSQLILDPKWEGTDRILNVENELFQSTQSTQYADKYLPTDVNNKDTKYRPVYYVDEEGIGRKTRDFQFSEQPLENNLVRDNLIEVPTDTPTNVELVKDTYVINTDTPTNVVDDIAKQNELINNFVNSMKTEGNLEFYVKHSGTEVPASSIQYNSRIGIGSQIPGFYTEPLGIRDIKTMGGRGGPNAISNYYKVQVNSNNLLISAGGGKVTGAKSPISNVGNANLGNQIEKIDWKIFEQETGLSWENDFNGKSLFSVERGEKVLSSDSQGFIRRLRGMGLTDDQISSALRKSGIEGFVSGPTNAQYEVVLLDPNDELGIGKNINVQDATKTDFVNNQSKVNQIDELITDTPTNVVGDEFVDNIVNANTQLVNDLPLSTTVKNQFNNLVQGRAKNLATPGGVADAVDVWELGVLGLMITAIAYKEYDEIPTIFKRTATNMFNSMTAPYNIPPVPLEQYDLDYEFIEKVITTGEKSNAY